MKIQQENSLKSIPSCSSTRTTSSKLVTRPRRLCNHTLLYHLSFILFFPLTHLSSLRNYKLFLNYSNRDKNLHLQLIKLSSLIHFQLRINSKLYVIDESYDIVLEEDGKIAKTSEYCEEIGYVFVNENKGCEKQKMVLEIMSNMSTKISVGLGNADDFRDLCSFICDGSMDEKVDCYEFTYSDGYKKRLNELDDSSDEEEPIGELAGPPFITGDIVEVEYNGTEISFLNRMTQQKISRKVQFSQKTKANVQFVVGLSLHDVVRILDQ